MTVPATIDVGLFALSVAIATLASYAAFEIVERIRVNRGTMQAIWILGGAVAMGVAFWGSQYIGMLASGMPQSAHLYLIVMQLSRIAAMIVSGLALYVAALGPLDRRSRFLASLAIAAGVVFAHSIAIAATAVAPSHISVYWPVVLLEYALTCGFAIICLALVARLRTLSGRPAFAMRLLAALTLSASISTLLFSGRYSLPITYLGEPQRFVGLDQYLVAIVAIVAFVFAAGSIAAARMDRRLRGERARSKRLEDLYTRQKRTALALQRALLPSDLPLVDGVTFSWSYVPSTIEDGVGGDWFDAFVLDDGRVALSIGDAAGHDTRSVIAMNIARQALRSGALLDEADPAAVLAHVNRVLLHSSDAALVTAIYGVLDPMTLRFAYACAGHPPPIRARVGTHAAMIPGAGSGLPMGLFPDAPATTMTLDLNADDVLVFFTDGVIERERNIISGIAALERAVEVVAATGEPDTAAALDRAIFGEGPRPDDAAIMTVRLDPVQREIDVRLPAIPGNVRRVRSAMRRFISHLDIDEALASAILLASGEAVANAVEHAYAGMKAPGDMLVRARSGNAGVEIVVEDFGCWSTSAGDPLRGRGLALMHELATIASIEAASTGTIVRLDFAFAPVAQAGRGDGVAAAR